MKKEQGINSIQKNSSTGISAEKFEALLSVSNKLNIFIENEIKSIPFGMAALFAVDSCNYSPLQDELLKKISGSDSIYLTVNKPAAFLKKKMQEMNASSEKVFFIDMITGLTSESGKKEKGVSFIGAPSELVESMLEVDNAFAVSNKKFIVLDSISTLLVYNDKKAVEKFIHSLISKINNFNSIGLLIAVNSENYSDKIKSLEQFCDKIITVKI
ncbi:MAG: hypothetical protein ABIA76_01950 [Candidatus Diapherotrites archaeon]